MKKRSYSLHTVYVLSEGKDVDFTRRFEASDFLVPWSYMEPQVESLEWGGPTYEYEDRGKKRKASVPLVAKLRTKQVEHWDVVIDHTKSHKSIAVKKEHARLDGFGYRLFDADFIEEHLVELRNRQSAYALLSNARDFDLAPLQSELLVELGQGSATLGELSSRSGRRPLHVRAAVLDLWRRQRVELPMRHSFVSDSWVVERLNHGHR